MICALPSALARILKFPIVFERVPIQNGPKWAKIASNGPKWSFFVHQKRKLPIKMTGMMGPGPPSPAALQVCPPISKILIPLAQASQTVWWLGKLFLNLYLFYFESESFSLNLNLLFLIKIFGLICTFYFQISNQFLSLSIFFSFIYFHSKKKIGFQPIVYFFSFNLSWSIFGLLLTNLEIPACSTQIYDPNDGTFFLYQETEH